MLCYIIFISRKSSFPISSIKEIILFFSCIGRVKEEISQKVSTAEVLQEPAVLVVVLCKWAKLKIAMNAKRTTLPDTVLFATVYYLTKI